MVILLAQSAETGSRIPLPVLVVLGLIILGGVVRLLFGGGGESQAPRAGFDPADSPEYYLIERDDQWEKDGYLGDDDDN